MRLFILGARTPRRAAAAPILAALLLAGCASVGPSYQAPAIAVPEGWARAEAARELAAAQPAGDLTAWWEQLADPTLTLLIERALAANLDGRTAQARLREARARLALAEANLYPSVTGSASAQRSRTSAQAGSGARIERYGLAIDASWELDVFGGRQSAVDAARADLENREASAAATRVSLAAEVALSYVQMRAFQMRLGIARDNLATQLDTLQLTEWRTQAGLTSALELEQVRTVVEQTRAQIPALSTGLAQVQHRIALLLAEMPESVVARLHEAGPIPEAPPRVATGIPAETLRQRPDVQAAERRVAAETARIRQADAARYPEFTLGGSIGLEALSLGGLGASGALASTVLGRVGGVLFDAGRLRSQVDVQTAVRDQALIAYESAVLTALSEVEDALMAVAGARQRRAALGQAAQAARVAARYALYRYSTGVIDFQAVLDTQRTVLAVEDNLAAASADAVIGVIQLYKALGGGWTPIDAHAAAERAGEASR